MIMEFALTALVIFAMAISTLIYCVITVRHSFSTGRRRVAWLGIIVAIWPIIAIGWTLWLVMLAIYMPH